MKNYTELTEGEINILSPSRIESMMTGTRRILQTRHGHVCIVYEDNTAEVSAKPMADIGSGANTVMHIVSHVQDLRPANIMTVVVGDRLGPEPMEQWQA